MAAQTTVVQTISGGYTAMYNGSNIGRTVNGFKIVANNHSEPVKTDDYGDVPADYVMRGTEYMVQLEYAEYALILAALNTAAATEGVASINVGLLASGIGKALVLTAIAGTPAAALATPTYTFPIAIILDDVDWMLANHRREGPVHFKCVPNSLGQLYVKS